MALATRTIEGNNGGPLRPRPKIVIMHATRSTIATKTDAEELLSTIYHFTGPSGASSHFILSEIERVRVVSDDLMAGHATYLNDDSWAVEMTQPTIDRPFTDGHYENAALVGRHYVSLGVDPVWLPYWDGNRYESGFVAHEDTIQGREVGKTDPGPQFDRERFTSSLIQIEGADLDEEDEIEMVFLLAVQGKPEVYAWRLGTGYAVHVDRPTFDAMKADGVHVLKVSATGIDKLTLIE